MPTKTIAIVIDTSVAASFAHMVARLLGSAVEVHRAVHILEVVDQIKRVSPDAVYYPSDVDQRLVHALLDESRAHHGALHFNVIGCSGMTEDDSLAVQRRARAA